MNGHLPLFDVDQIFSGWIAKQPYVPGMHVVAYVLVVCVLSVTRLVVHE